MQNFKFTASTQVEFNPSSDNEEAGLILLNNGSHFDILVKKSGGKRVLVSRLRFGSVIYESKEVVLKAGPVKMAIQGESGYFIFKYTQGNDAYKELARADANYISSETIGGFTGLYVGLYATGNGRSSLSDADYDWFEYIESH